MPINLMPADTSAPLYVDSATFTDDGGGYEWQEMRVYTKVSDGKIFAYGDGGCSCNSYEHPEESQLVELSTLDEAHRFWSAAISWDNGAERWIDKVRPEFVKLGLH